MKKPQQILPEMGEQFRLFMKNPKNTHRIGAALRTWNFEAPSRPSDLRAAEALNLLQTNWDKIAREISGITWPIAFSGSKLRRLNVSVIGEGIPPWGGWTYRSVYEYRRRIFTKLRADINTAISPHEVDHIFFIPSDPPKSKPTTKINQ